VVAAWVEENNENKMIRVDKKLIKRFGITVFSFMIVIVIV